MGPVTAEHETNQLERSPVSTYVETGYPNFAPSLTWDQTQSVVVESSHELV